MAFSPGISLDEFGSPGGVSAKERVKTPDSPEGARLMLASSTPTSTNSVSPTASSATPTALSAVLRHGAPHLQNGGGGGGTVSPILNGSGASGGSLSPPLPLSLSLLEQGAAHNQSRALGKLKRFLSTLVQFGSDIAADTGERVRALVFSLVSNSITIEEFHHSLQDVTNFPLRPFVVPFLRAHLPLLQRELNSLARLAKQSPQQYLRHHEHVVLDPAFSPSEPSEIFHSDVTENGKRRATDSYYENGLPGSADAEYIPAPKRHHPHLLMPPGGGLLFSPGAGSHPHVPPPPHLHPSSDYPQQYGYPGYPPAPHQPDLLADRRQGDDEWKNIHVMLNCILSMVEKTKRALAILQHRSSGSASENGSGPGSEWLRRPNPGDASEARDIKRTAGEIMAQTIRVTEDRVAEVKRRAEEAVNEVKRQAVAELQRAVAAAESKACELVATERAKMEKLLLEARKQAAEEALAAVVVANQQQQQQAESSDAASAVPAPSQQNSCWNCGRKANETCSGCNMARYCGAFCQHKDWENHHQVCCGRSVNLSSNTAEKNAPTRSASSSRSATPVTASSSTNAAVGGGENRAKK
ncbi:protein CBFA2T1 [Anabrus simplex]|uniref:protein CBFA2T1 n=1 Tax=Anabrus simplex TaxID=316456 RepID=UPI0035A3325A